MMGYFFKAEQVCIGYQDKMLLRNIEFELQRGEILTLIGSNGVGKSTMLKSIARQLKLLEGVIYLDKWELSCISGAEFSQKMAVVFTERLKTEMMSCEDVVATGRYPYTGYFGILAKEDYGAVEEAMKLAHVTEIRKQDFRKISDGQRQRVMLARAICQEPEILILDEPTSFLDIKYKLEFISVLQELKRKKGLTVIMSLHELELAERISDKILCLKEEYVERFGTPEEIFQPGYIRQLYGITTGSFDERSGNMELEAPEGLPEFFVLAGGGSGRNVYRRLQRQGRAFATGIIYENDLDYPVAGALAVEVVTAEAFEPMTEEAYERAKQLMDKCKSVICTRKSFGKLEQFNEKLLCYAEKSGKIIEDAECCDIWQR